MRRILIQHLLPAVLCVVPLLAATLVAVAVPSAALDFYLQRVSESRVDWLILGLGVVIFTIQLMLSWRSLQWRGTRFDERPDFAPRRRRFAPPPSNRMITATAASSAA